MIFIRALGRKGDWKQRNICFQKNLWSLNVLLVMGRNQR